MPVSFPLYTPARTGGAASTKTAVAGASGTTSVQVGAAERTVLLAPVPAPAIVNQAVPTTGATTPTLGGRYGGQWPQVTPGLTRPTQP
ncbi:hypothetical protein PC129_g13446 [Phytophthora cactorum]|uniref:Uncharacterized protein n=1 Tax=Phytophthora cactorum TaxID=29920 RepID=A0A329S177_9STRA|nr:hypothetical protein Pcac1_g16814 [Phytophthora cactorum]KAG2782037.1 hypothetical protein Pcac1_g8130 [Phytophthora cactorum]KAG2893887.1 hypothetical protein PC114_g16101 [Phytophthora cactorum]KAG2898529.1 hypothetical protein PC115_g16823 [Phytophthora cactorum]KAG2913880.1 hypothetical protein PC117_g18488 [Phytophthora cactorum]